MSLQTTIPDNKSFLSPVGFQFSIQKLPHVNYFCTSAQIPDISVNQGLTYPTPFKTIDQPGDKITYGQLQLKFRVDEDLRNFQEIFDWMIGIGYPDNFNQRAAIESTVFSDGSLIIMTGSGKPNINVKFEDLYPVSLEGLDFDISSTDIEYLEGNVRFSYKKYSLTTLL